MKTVSGVVVTSKPVSLTQAAKILSKFAFADNGASPAFVAYLKRASDSFNELVRLHKELRGSDSERKIKKHRSRNHDLVELASSVQNYGEDVVSVTDKEGGAREDGRRLRKKIKIKRNEREN